MTTQTQIRSTEEALKLALELLAVGTFHSPELQAKRTEVIEQGLNALAQPEQEPVATVGDLVPSRRWNLELPEDAKLYATPLQRKLCTCGQLSETFKAKHGL